MLKHTLPIAVLGALLLIGAGCFSVPPKKIALPPTPPEQSCRNLCGDGQCQEIVCLAIGCPCAESAASCPRDCGG